MGKGSKYLRNIPVEFNQRENNPLNILVQPTMNYPSTMSLQRPTIAYKVLQWPWKGLHGFFLGTTWCGWRIEATSHCNIAYYWRMEATATLPSKTQHPYSQHCLHGLMWYAYLRTCAVQKQLWSQLPETTTVRLCPKLDKDGKQRAFPTRIHWGNVYEKKRYNVWNEIQKHWPPTYDSSLKWYGLKEEGEAFWCHNQGQDMPSSIVKSDISAWYYLEMKRIFL